MEAKPLEAVSTNMLVTLTVAASRSSSARIASS